MARRMIDPQTIIKSQIADDKNIVDLNEILEKYGTQSEWGKSATLQFYSKVAGEELEMRIVCNTVIKGSIIPNSAITITKDDEDYIYISGLMVDNLENMNLLNYIEINDTDYENGIILSSPYHFDVHVIKV